MPSLCLYNICPREALITVGGWWPHHLSPSPPPVPVSIFMSTSSVSRLSWRWLEPQQLGITAM